MVLFFNPFIALTPFIRQLAEGGRKEFLFFLLLYYNKNTEKSIFPNDWHKPIFMVK